MIHIYNFTYTQVVAKLANSDIIHIIIAIHYLHVYTIYRKLHSYTAGLLVFNFNNKKQGGAVYPSWPCHYYSILS